MLLCPDKGTKAGSLDRNGQSLKGKRPCRIIYG